MNSLAERYMRLSQSYIYLAERFQTLDIEYMTLKSKILPLLKVLKDYRQTVEQLNHDKQLLEENLQKLTAKYQELQSLETLLSPEAQTSLAEAEVQMALIDKTLQKMEESHDPDLNEEDKLFLSEDYSTLTEPSVEYSEALQQRSFSPYAKESAAILITPQLHRFSYHTSYPLRGTTVQYLEPTEPIAQDDWEAAQ